MTSEKTLLQRAKTYDPAALAELYDRYADRIYAYIYRRTGNPAVAEDLTSELFLRMLQAIKNDRAWHSSFTAWFYRSAHNLVVDHYRRQAAAPEASLDEFLPAPGEALSAAVESRLEEERLHQAMRQLTPEQQEVLALRYGEGLKAREVGAILDKSTGAVEALQRRGLAALQRILSGERE